MNSDKPLTDAKPLTDEELTEFYNIVGREPWRSSVRNGGSASTAYIARFHAREKDAWLDARVIAAMPRMLDEIWRLKAAAAAAKQWGDYERDRALELKRQAEQQCEAAQADRQVLRAKLDALQIQLQELEQAHKFTVDQWASSSRALTARDKRIADLEAQAQQIKDIADPK